MVVIRLARFGKKNHPTFRVIVSDKQKDTQGTYLEQVGSYNPHMQPATIDFDADRVKHWLSVGAQPSPTVHNLLVEKGLLDAPKKVVGKPKKKSAAEGEEPKAEAPAPEAKAEEAKQAEASAEPKAEAEEKPAEPAAEEKSS